jgi:hypothetical protein
MQPSVLRGSAHATSSSSSACGARMRITGDA